SAKNQLNLTALQVGFDEKMGGGNHYRNESVNDVVISNIKGNGNVTLAAKNIYSEGADLAAKEKLIALAENDIVLGSATRSSDYEEYHRIKSSGAFGSSKKTSLDTDQQTLKVGTKLGGGEIILSAGHDVEAHNLQAIADNDLIIQGGNNVTIGSDVNRFKTTHFEEKSKSGVFSGGGIGITFGKKSEKHEQETEGWQGSEARSTLGSLNGNITVSAGNHAHLAGVDAIASKELGKQILVEGKSTYIGASEDTLSSRERHEQKQSGLTIAFSSAVTDGVMAAKQALNRSSEVKDERLGALLKVKAANEAYETVKKAQSLIETIQNASNVTEAAGNSDFKISVSAGASKNVSTSHTQQTTHKGSELDAGKVIVRATEGDNTIAGSKINATRTELEGNNVNLLGTTNSQTNRSDNKSSSWSVGVFVGKSQGSTGFGVEGAVNVGKGHSNSDSTVQNQTEINSDSLKIKAKETTTLKGTVANINHLALDTKNLHIESVQDTEKYDSKQTQGGVSGSVAIYGSGSSVSAQVSQQKANVDYAQVTQQSGFNIQESSNINVEENTHIKGGIIHAQGDKANHQMTTGTLTTEVIENRSDIEVSRVSAGASTDMGQMATMAVGAALSALGNMRESERSQTQSAISNNINLTIADNEKQKALTGKTAEETLASLNRDTANANQAVEKADLNAIQEKQETVQVIGELSQSWTNRLVQPHLEEANKKRQEAEKLEKSDPLKSAQLKAEAKAIEAEYGLGSNLQMGIRAATAALQGLATGNANQAAVGLLSPYANKLIKEQTTNADGSINKEANLMAHAVLGALEAHITGNNAAAGALGAFTAEAAAPYLMQALYNTDNAENLTDSQKQNIANLSQIAAGLAGGVVGDSSADFISGAEIGKRAVENNFLSQAEYAELNRLMEKKILTPEEAMRVQYLLEKDKVSDRLLDAYQTNPNSLSQKDREILFKWVREYGNVPMQLKLLETPISSPQMRPDYSDLKFRAQQVYNYSGSVQGQLSESLATGLSAVGTGGNSVVIKGIQYVEKAAKVTSSTAQTAANTFGAFAAKYPNATGMLADGTVALGVHAGYKVSTGQEINPYEAIGAFGSGALTKNRSIPNQVRINIGIATVTSLSKDPSGNDLGNAYFGAISSPVSGYFFNKIPVVGNAMGPVATEYFSDLEALQRTYNTLDEKVNKVSQQKEGSK
ncbi:hemagglutinin repeat-containing protein, partial [Glaesserella parasuis]|uniref:hemagglutinin repeat-containing protein n=1 Tax=Glaesserella parasuis TaxID=738 RepID=UPI002436739D